MVKKRVSHETLPKTSDSKTLATYLIEKVGADMGAAMMKVSVNTLYSWASGRRKPGFYAGEALRELCIKEGL